MIYGTKDGCGGAVVMYDANDETSVHAAIKAQGVPMSSHQTFTAADLDDAEKGALAELFGGTLPAAIMQSYLPGSGAMHLDKLVKAGIAKVKA